MDRSRNNERLLVTDSILCMESLKIGMDCDYYNQVGEGDCFIKDYNDSTKHPGNFLTDKMFITYRNAKEYAEAHGIKIYNATRGGNLEEFARVDFDRLFSGGGMVMHIVIFDIQTKLLNNMRNCILILFSDFGFTKH